MGDLLGVTEQQAWSAQHRLIKPTRAVRRRWSWPAVAAFAAAAMGFLLAGVMLGPAAVVLGVLGIFDTQARRRRGLLLALAAVPAGVVGALAGAHTFQLG